MKKIVIFGATGNTGLCSLKHAVDSGKQVIAFVRDKNKVPEDLKNQVSIVVGDVTNADSVSDAITGVDGVAVVLGTRNDLNPTTVLSEGMKNIISGMKKHNVEKVSVCLSAFLFYELERVPAVFKDLNADHQRQLDVLKASGLKYIAVLPPHIAESPSSKYTVVEGKSPGRAISKWDLGAFLIESLEKEEYYGKIVGLANI